jgi:NADPH:quinone reductase-like Zn-dependent oxidoreductase
MKIVQLTEYGDYDKLQLTEVKQPVLKEGELLVKVYRE